jgi:hypothetical protein
MRGDRYIAAVSLYTLDHMSRISQVQKNIDSTTYGMFRRITESTNITELASRYITHGVTDVAATMGLIIIIVAPINPAVLHHCIAFHAGDIVKFYSS